MADFGLFGKNTQQAVAGGIVFAFQYISAAFALFGMQGQDFFGGSHGLNLKMWEFANLPI